MFEHLIGNLDTGLDVPEAQSKGFFLGSGGRPWCPGMKLASTTLVASPLAFLETGPLNPEILRNHPSLRLSGLPCREVRGGVFQMKTVITIY